MVQPSGRLGISPYPNQHDHTFYTALREGQLFLWASFLVSMSINGDSMELLTIAAQGGILG